MPSRLDEIRNDLHKFMVETKLELRKETVFVPKEDLIEISSEVR